MTLIRMSWLQHDQAPMEDNFYDTVPHIFRQLKWLKIAKENCNHKTCQVFEKSVALIVAAFVAVVVVVVPQLNDRSK
jgi:hypothetical protein